MIALTLATLLALGDSYTVGESVPAEEAFPRQLAHALKIGEPQIVAKTGWTTDELEWAIRQAKLKGPFDVVTLLIGVNDQYRGRSAEEYRKHFVVLLKRAIAFAGGRPARVVVVSIPDWGVTPFARGRDRKKIAAEIDQFNAINHKEAIHAGARYADITAVSRHAAFDPSLIAPDGLHPSGRMYAEWLRVILPEAKAALRLRN